MHNDDHHTTSQEDASAHWRHHLFDVAAENFPYPVLLSKADVGEILPLVAHPHQPALQVIHRGQVAGHIVVDGHDDLMTRIRTGEQFEGIVSENYGGRCRLLVRPIAKNERFSS